MSPNTPGVRAQAIVRVIPGGGTKNAAQISNQWSYVSREGDIPLERSDRYFEDAAPIRPDEVADMTKDWETQAAVHPGLIKADGSRRDITTHIVASLPRAANADLETAKATLREFAFEMFGSGRNGGQWDYVTAFHTDREHPHLHIVVNRMSHEGRWLKIARRDPFMNYDNMRAVMADVAERRGYNLDSTTRAERGIIERPVTYAEHRRRSRQRVAIYPQPISDAPSQEPRALRANPSLRQEAADAAQAVVDAAAARLRAREVAAAAAARGRERLEAEQEANLGDVAGDFGDDNAHGADRAPIAERRRRRRREAAVTRSNVETRAQRARREMQDAIRERIDKENRRQDKIARRQQDARQGPNVETRAARREREQLREREQMQLRSGRMIDRNASQQDGGSRTSTDHQRDDRNDRQR